MDLVGDGSFGALSTAGHSPGHISYLVNAKSGPVLITGDAAAYYDQLTHKVRPNPGVYDVDLATDSLLKISEFAGRYPKMKVFVGHERVNEGSN